MISLVLQRVLASLVSRMVPLGTLGRICARRGEPGAWQCLDEAMAAAVGTGDPGYVVARAAGPRGGALASGRIGGRAQRSRPGRPGIGWRRPLAARRVGGVAAPHRIRPRAGSSFTNRTRRASGRGRRNRSTRGGPDHGSAGVARPRRNAAAGRRAQEYLTPAIRTNSRLTAGRQRTGCPVQECR